jgi:hypothetical protein
MINKVRSYFQHSSDSGADVANSKTQFWNVKVVSRRPNSSITGEEANEPAYVEEEQRETHSSLKEKQIKMEQQVYRIWT